VPIENAGQTINLQGATWNALVEYINMLERRLPALQRMVSQTRDTSEARFADVEGELGLIGADLGQGGDIPGGPYTSLWSAFGASLEEKSRFKLYYHTPGGASQASVHQGPAGASGLFSGGQRRCWDKIQNCGLDEQ
jgi:hypothetical protein